MGRRRRTEPRAIWSLVCCLVGIFLVPFAVAGIVLGFKARSRIIRAEGATRGEGLAVAGIVVGFITVTLFVVVGLIVVIGHSGPSGDAALAQRELVPASAYPRGFTGQGSGSEFHQASYFSGFAGRDTGPVLTCLGLSGTHVDTNPAEAANQEYDRGRLTINNTTDVFPSRADAIKDASASAAAGSLHCLFRYLGNQDWGPGLGSGERDRPPKPLGVSAIGAVAGAGSGGHDSLERWSVRYTYQGKSGIEYVDWVTVQRGRSESTLEITQLGSPIPSAIVQDMVPAVERRLQSQRM
jgi:hypothetical protein